MGSYARLLDRPSRRQWVVAGLIGRLHRSMSMIALLLLIEAHSDSYGVAGVIAAVTVVGSGIGGPAWSRAVDRRGQRAVIPYALATTVLSLVALLMLIDFGAPRWTWAVASFAVGATSLDFGTLMRSRWAAVLETSEDKHTALTLESIIDELSYVMGPAIAAVMAASWGGELALSVATAAGVVGGVVLWGTAERHHVRLLPQAAVHGARKRLLPTGVAPMLVVYVGLGLLFASVDLASVAAAEEADRAALGGIIVGAFAAGSVIGGLITGPLLARWSPLRRLVICGVAFAVMLQTLTLASNVSWMPLLGLIAGLTTSPLLISAMGYVQEYAEPHRRTEAMAWPSVAMSVGVTIGSTVTGVLIDSVDAFEGYKVASLGGLVAGATVIVVWLWTRMQRRAGQGAVAQVDSVELDKDDLASVRPR